MVGLDFFLLWLLKIKCCPSQGSGKTLLACAVAKHVEDHNDILAHVYVSLSKYVG